MDVRLEKASAVMRALHHTIKNGSYRKTKLLMFKSIFVLILTYCHESWVMTERVRSQMQASEIKFLQKVQGLTMFDKLRNTAF